MGFLDHAPIKKQTSIACEKVKFCDKFLPYGRRGSGDGPGYNGQLQDGEVSDGCGLGYDSRCNSGGILGLGNLIARGIIEFCDGRPPVKNFISLGGPHAGIASIPYCKAHLAPSGYVKISTDMDAYIKGCEFLRYLNNEIIGKRNSTYRSRFSSLENVVFIKFDHDEVLIPKETAWFGYYAEGTSDPVLPAQKRRNFVCETGVKQTKLYEEDWIGLRTLDEVGKAKFISVSGNHLDISLSDMKTFIVPYLKDPISMVTRPEIDTLRALI
ncbi:hypothetical protein RIF29_29871 [Crotalaria pallida]|uniref:Uncharacterized protein n=1 Tax=Crotalaria pallida TaxID=3830 RepID=A0AAN9EKH2_CROPI